MPLAVAVRPLLAARPWLGDVAPAGSAGSTPGALRGLLARGEVNLVLAQSVLERRQPGGAAGGSGGGWPPAAPAPAPAGESLFELFDAHVAIGASAQAAAVSHA